MKCILKYIKIKNITIKINKRNIDVEKILICKWLTNTVIVK